MNGFMFVFLILVSIFVFTVGISFGIRLVREEAVENNKALYCLNLNDKDSSNDKVFTWGSRCSTKGIKR